MVERLRGSNTARKRLALCALTILSTLVAVGVVVIRRPTLDATAECAAPRGSRAIKFYSNHAIDELLRECSAHFPGACGSDVRAGRPPGLECWESVCSFVDANSYPCVPLRGYEDITRPARADAVSVLWLSLAQSRDPEWTAANGPSLAETCQRRTRLAECIDGLESAAPGGRTAYSAAIDVAEAIQVACDRRGTPTVCCFSFDLAACEAREELLRRERLLERSRSIGEDSAP